MTLDERTIRVLVADSAREGRERFRKILGDLKDCDLIGMARDGQEAAQIALQRHPDVLLAIEDLSVLDGFRMAELVSLGAPDVRIALFGKDPTPEKMRQAMRSGARAYVSLPLRPDEVHATIKELAALEDQRKNPEFEAVSDPNKGPRVVVVTGAKGGIGKSTIATNLAVGLAKQTGDRVVLIDLYTQFGDVSAMMNIVPTRTICDLVPVAQEMDLQLLEDHMVVHESGVRVLVGSVEPAGLQAIPVAVVEAILNLLRLNYRFVVVDMPPFLHDTNLHVLSYCSHLLLVANLFDITTVSDAKKFFQAVEGKYVPKEKIHMVLNRSSKFNRLVAADVVRALDHPIAAEVPNDSRLVYALNQGVPIVMSRPNSPVAQSIKQLADTVAHSNGFKKLALPAKKK